MRARALLLPLSLTMAGFLALAVACGPSSPAAVDPSPAATATPPTPAPPADAPTERLCALADGSLTFYLYVHSASAHNFTACAGATTYPGTLDTLFRIPSMDRICIVPVRDGAMVAVYADARNRVGARAYCIATGGTANGA